MKSNSEGKKRLNFRMSDKVILGVLSVLILVMVVISILDHCHLSMINGAIMVYLPVISLFVLVGWGGYALIRRIRKPVVKTVAASIGVLLMLAAVTLVVSYAAYVAYYTVPQRFATLASPSGEHKLAVMRGFDSDEARAQARKAARLERDPDGEQELTAGDLLMTYRAYPQVLGLFYRTDADVEGEVYLAYETPAEAAAQGEDASGTEPAPQADHGTLMVEWLDDDATAHFYVENPGVSEGGDCYLRF